MMPGLCRMVGQSLVAPHSVTGQQLLPGIQLDHDDPGDVVGH